MPGVYPRKFSGVRIRGQQNKLATIIMIKLTTREFTDSIARHIEASKPDQLTKTQIESLHITWEEQEKFDGIVDGSGCDAGTQTSSLRGTLTLSSDYISVAIQVVCNWKKTDYKSRKRGQSSPKRFQEEFYIKLTASARERNVAALFGSNKNERQLQQDLGGRKVSEKLRDEMLSRLRSDHYIRQLFGDNENNDNAEGATLCEALIQQNLQPPKEGKSIGSNSGRIDELEERVNVDEGTLQGIKNAIFSQCEDNLDVLELLLNMPYLHDKGAAVSNQLQSKLAERAYLRLLEDAMFDACEKEGEDELLDDLNISKGSHYQHEKMAKGGKEGCGRGEERLKRICKGSL